MLELENVGKDLGGKPVIDASSLRVGAGEIVCVTGPSGAGKSTLLEIMAGLLPPDRGRVVLNVRPALAFQDDVLLPWLGASGNMDYALSALSREERSRRTGFWLERFGLEGAAMPRAMSGGMRRRLNLARAFALERRLLLLDEPYAFLDRFWRERVTEEILRLVRNGGAVVMVSHQTEDLEDLACRMLAVAGSPIRLRG